MVQRESEIVTTFLQTSRTLTNWKPADRLKTRELQGIPRGQLVHHDFCTIRKTVGWGCPKIALNAAEYSGSEGFRNRDNLFANFANTCRLEARRGHQNTWIIEDSEKVMGSARLLQNKENYGNRGPGKVLKRRGIQRFRGNRK